MSEKINSVLSNKKIFVKHIPRHKAGVTQKDHPLWGGMLDIAEVTFYTKRGENGSYVDPFTEEEKKYVAKALSKSVEDLSIYKKEDNFYDNTKVVLTKRGATLNMANIDDFIKYKILLTNDGIICPNPQSIRNKPSYRFYLVDEASEISTKSKSLSSRKQAYKSYGKFEDDKNKLGYIIWQMTDKMPSRDVELDVLQANIEDNDILEVQADKFNKLVSDKLFEYKALIYKGLINGVITRKSGEYYMEGSLILKSGSTGNLHNTAQFLADPINQETKFLIEDRINNAKE